MNTGIYIWKSPSNKVYVGQSIDLQRRHKEFTTNPFSYNYTTKDSAIDKARRKYPDFSKWEYRVLEYCPKEVLDDMEMHYIKFFDSMNSRKGYNSCEGGKGIKAFYKPYVHTTRRSYVGANNPNFGKHHTEEAREKIRQSRLGKPLPLETCKKLMKPVTQYSMEGIEIKRWEGIALVTRELGIDTSSIIRVCKGKKKSAGGFKWSY